MVIGKSEAAITAPSEERLQRLDAHFHGLISILHQRLEDLLAGPGFTASAKPRGLKGKCAVYLFSDGPVPFYVGRTKNLEQRIGNHCNEGSQPNQSSIAFKLACADLKIEREKYAKGQGWKDLMTTYSDLASAFSERKRQMGKMQIRYVEETDPVRQALLEIYCAAALNTPHNDFDTH